MKKSVHDFFFLCATMKSSPAHPSNRHCADERFLLLSSKRRKMQHKQTEKLHTIGAYENRSWTIFPFLHSRPHLDWHRKQNKTKRGSELNFFFGTLMDDGLILFSAVQLFDSTRPALSLLTSTSLSLSFSTSGSTLLNLYLFFSSPLFYLWSFSAD